MPLATISLPCSLATVSITCSGVDFIASDCLWSLVFSKVLKKEIVVFEFT